MHEGFEQHLEMIPAAPLGWSSIAFQHIALTEVLPFLQEHARKHNTGISQMSNKVTYYLAQNDILSTLLEKEELLGHKRAQLF